MKTFYNEFDPFAAKWLRNLSAAGKISRGDVDERDFREIKPKDVAADRYERCHFFAGIGGWDLALQLAEWPEDEPVWTASLPCQPFSVAGRGLGEQDDRHLFPDFARLVAKCHPPTIFGEQVASKAGREWLAGVRSQMEALGYSFGAADLCAPCVGAPHIRQRFFWVADSESEGLGGRPKTAKQTGERRVESAFVPHGTLFWRSRNYRTAPGVPQMVDGVPGRVGLIRGYGNAIVPQVAAEFITAFRETQK